MKIVEGYAPPSIAGSRALRRRRPQAGALAAAALLLALVAAPLFAPQAVVNDLGQAVVLGLFAISFNVLFRYSGLLSFGHAAFFGVAAYGQALLLQHVPGAPVPLLVIATVAGTAALGFAFGQVCVRRAGVYFSMITLAIAAFVATVAFKWHDVTGGTDGLGGFVPDTLALLPGLPLPQPTIAQLYWLALAFALPAATATWMLLELTPFGNAVAIVRQNEERAVFLGYDAHALRLASFVLAAALAGLAGALWALLNGLVSTDSIDLALSTNVIVMALVGGTGWFWGPLLGSLLYVFGSDRLSTLTEHKQLWMGLVFIAIVLLCPSGVAGLTRIVAGRLGLHDRHD